MAIRDTSPRALFDKVWEANLWTKISVEQYIDAKPIFGQVVCAELRTAIDDLPEYSRALVLGTRLGNVIVRFTKTNPDNQQDQTYHVVSDLPETLVKLFGISIPSDLVTGLSVPSDQVIDGYCTGAYMGSFDIGDMFGFGESVETEQNIGELLENIYLTFLRNKAERELKAVRPAMPGELITPDQADQLLRDASSTRVVDLAPTDMADVAATAIFHQFGIQFDSAADTMTLLGNIATLIRRSQHIQKDAMDGDFEHFVKSV